ncbi:relaxase [Enteroscipio rubneri]|uniref:Relaxase n=2 Tax=Enteroscipio rubneri TaxID=2070686 RepID=A0A2K2U8V7_9ACTN|nr:relaxase [Enteroscipio rubneri]
MRPHEVRPHPPFGAASRQRDPRVQRPPGRRRRQGDIAHPQGNAPVRHEPEPGDACAQLHLLLPTARKAPIRVPGHRPPGDPREAGCRERPAGKAVRGDVTARDRDVREVVRMPVLKPISGHGSCVPVQRYLEKNGRALARDFFNFSETPDADLMREPESGKPFDWATEMDAFRAECGNDDPWNGKRARTFKHFVLSPSPEDEVSLDELRELAHAWALRFFPEHHIAIIYHDDNENRIPHAHIVVNNTNVVTGRRMRTDNPLDLNRALQEMAAERGLRALSNERPEPSTGFQRLAANKGEPRAKARTLQETYRSRAERRAEAAGGYSWVADIRNRVSVAKGLARNEQEFRSILVMMGVGIEDNSPRARRQDWIFSLADAPARRVSGERLGASFGKAALERRLLGARAEHLPDASSREFLRLARKAVELKDLDELDSLSNALEVCGKWRIMSLDAADSAIAAQRGRLRNGVPASQETRIWKEIEALEHARDFLKERKALPLHDVNRRDDRASGKGGWAGEPSGSERSAPQREQPRERREERQR